jgi:predicted MPP superfamily phosphohydrolase
VLGNHAHAVGAADELTAALEDVGIPALLNEAVPVEGRDGDLHVVGIGPETPSLAHVEEAMSDIPDDAPRVVLMHNPTVFDALPDGSAPLSLAGTPTADRSPSPAARAGPT